MANWKSKGEIEAAICPSLGQSRSDMIFVAHSEVSRDAARNEDHKSDNNPKGTETILDLNSYIHWKTNGQSFWSTAGHLVVPARLNMAGLNWNQGRPNEVGKSIDNNNATPTHILVRKFDRMVIRRWGKINWVFIFPHLNSKRIWDQFRLPFLFAFLFCFEVTLCKQGQINLVNSMLIYSTNLDRYWQWISAAGGRLSHHMLEKPDPFA